MFLILFLAMNVEGMKDGNKIKLRQKKERNGKISLFLDKYDNGKRTYEYLRMYLTGNKKEDEITLAVAERICEERNKSIEVEFDCNNEIGRMTIHNFIDLYFVRYKAIKNIIPPTDKVSQLNKDYERIFTDKVRNGNYADSTKVTYIREFRAVKNRAIDLDGVPMFKSPKLKIKYAPKERVYLTMDELKRLGNIEIKDRHLDGNRRAFCFSCLTGLRVSDIRNLCWDNISEQDGYKRITFTQKKTKSTEYLDISNSAYRFLGNRGTGKIFDVKLWNKQLTRIMPLADIDKHITYHCARHTFAIMMLGLGVDIYTLSKLLGHSDIAVTQVYARILDQNKRSAVDLIPEI